MAVSVGLTRRDIKSSSMTQPVASLKFLSIYHANTHACAHTQLLSDHSPVSALKKEKAEEEDAGWGRGSGRDITSLCARRQ